jgi:peroxiredoxin
MMRFACLTLVAVAVILPHSLPAGEYNELLNIGDAAPSWAGLPGVDDKQHSSADFKEKNVLVVVFTCNSCPFAVAYEDRLIALCRKYAGPDGKVGMVAINVNKIPQDSLAKMQARAKEKEFPFPYLFDETQKIGKEFGAGYTPEVFVLNQERKIVYMGGIDDNSDPELVKHNYLEAAVQAALKGEKPATTETFPRGCRIRYARERKGE